MINEYLPNQLLREEVIKRDWLFNNVDKDNNWLSGNLIIPFEGGWASSVSFGELTASSDVSEYSYVRGQITSQPEMWSTLVFNQRDLYEHGKVNEQNFLQQLPGQIEDFMSRIKQVASVQCLGGSHFATVTVNGTVGGVVEVDHPERFTKGQKVVAGLSTPSATTFWVISVDNNGGSLGRGSVTLSDTKANAATGTTTSAAALTTALSAKFYHPGVLDGSGVVTNTFTGLRSQLLSAANGGSSTLFGQSKLAYPFLQAINVSGAAINATNILEQLFDAYTRVRSVGRGGADKFVMSYKHLGSIMKAIETQKGGFKVSPTSTTASEFGWREIQITSVKGDLTIVGIQEMDDDVIFILDMKALKFYSNGFFKKRVDPETGSPFFAVRATTGYSYLVDICLFGDLALLAPSKCGIIYNIPAY